jgi:hypothetical protein
MDTNNGIVVLLIAAAMRDAQITECIPILPAVFRIRDVLIQFRIKIRGSVPLD